MAQRIRLPRQQADDRGADRAETGDADAQGFGRDTMGHGNLDLGAGAGLNSMDATADVALPPCASFGEADQGRGRAEKDTRNGTTIFRRLRPFCATRKKSFLENVGVGTGSGKLQPLARYAVDQKPIRLQVEIAPALPIAL